MAGIWINILNLSPGLLKTSTLQKRTVYRIERRKEHVVFFPFETMCYFSAGRFTDWVLRSQINAISMKILRDQCRDRSWEWQSRKEAEGSRAARTSWMGWFLELQFSKVESRNFEILRKKSKGLCLIEIDAKTLVALNVTVIFRHLTRSSVFFPLRQIKSNSLFRHFAFHQL